MPTSTQSSAKEQVRSLLDKLPDDCTLADLQYHLYVMQGVQEGLDALDRGEGLSHEEVKRRLAKWLSS